MWTSKAYPTILLSLFVLVGYPACSKSDEPDNPDTVAQEPTIVGKWSWNNGLTTEYRADGTFAHPDGWIGNWEVDGDSLTVTQSPETYYTYTIVELSNDRLVIQRTTDNRAFRGERLE